MAFDFKKEYKELYMPKGKPEIVNVPRANYIAVRGKGDPNDEGGAYQQAIGVLYAVAYTLKMSYKTEHKIPGFFEYVVPPLEGFWRQDDADGVNYAGNAMAQIKRLESLGFGNLPICMAKTQYSLSDNEKLLGRPSGFSITVREAYVSAGAGFIVVLTGNVMTMPGLPKKPAAYSIDVDENGMITGLF